MLIAFWLWMWACGDPDGPEPVCAWSTTAVKYPPGEGPARAVEGTTLYACRAGDGFAGRWVERYPSGAVAADGQADGAGWLGVVTVWAEDGAFVSSATWEGAAVRTRRFVGPDGRIVEVELGAQADGGEEAVVDLRVVPYDTPVDEWRERTRVQGTAYHGVVGGVAGAQ